MNVVFLDTVGLVAKWDRADQWYATVVPIYRTLVRRRVRLVTTPDVLTECGNTAARRAYRADVVATRRLLLALGNLIEPTKVEIDQAWRNYAVGYPGGPSIVDEVSFVVMRRLGITEAFTNDKHFRAAGFVTLF